MLISIGSKNPAKIAAVEAGFKHYNCTIIPVKVDSLVSDQPMTDEETIRGAVNRAENALSLSGADLGIGLEGGVQQTAHGLFLCNWGALVIQGSRPFIAGGARIPLPEEVAVKVNQGMELGPVMEEWTRSPHVRKQEGAVGVFTNGRIDRKTMFTHIIELLAGQFEFAQKDKRF